MIEINPKAFFFDFDGVICDSERAHMLATLKTVKSQNMSFTEEYYFEKLFGFDDVGLFEHVYEKHGEKLTPEELRRLILEKNQEFLSMVEEHVIFFPGVKDFIRSLTERNIPLAVVSGALKNEVEACLIKGGLRDHFLFTVCADDVKRSKPNPESYESAYTQMLKVVPSLEKNDCWVLEDSPTGIHSAKGAELKIIGITNSTKKENLSDADYIVSDYKEIQF